MYYGIVKKLLRAWKSKRLAPWFKCSFNLIISELRKSREINKEEQTFRFLLATLATYYHPPSSLSLTAQLLKLFNVFWNGERNSNQITSIVLPLKMWLILGRGRRGSGLSLFLILRCCCFIACYTSGGIPWCSNSKRKINCFQRLSKSFSPLKKKEEARATNTRSNYCSW